jgi:hypothetical protein
MIKGLPALIQEPPETLYGIEDPPVRPRRFVHFQG